jgi:hypothetical protein
MFYRTQDRQYFFKTLLHPEVGVMMDMLKDYHKYLSDAPKNFIMRVVGLYRLTYSPAKQIWVLVFKNVFPPGVAIDETYDLKGRKPKRTNTPVVGGGPVKDNQIQRQIYFTAPEVTQFYREQLNQDIDVSTALESVVRPLTSAAVLDEAQRDGLLAARRCALRHGPGARDTPERHSEQPQHQGHR